MPGPRGRAPTSSAMSQSRKAVFGSSVAIMPASNGKAQSSSSIITPLQRLLRLFVRDLEQLQDDGLLGAEHVAAGDPEQQAVADLTGGTGDRDAHGGFHGEGSWGDVNCNFSTFGRTSRA